MLELEGKPIRLESKINEEMPNQDQYVQFFDNKLKRLD
jgi:hypothetical protein